MGDEQKLIFTIQKFLLTGNGMEWNGKWYGIEGEFWYGIWKMLRMKGIGRFEKWNGRSSSILPYRLCIFKHTTTNYRVTP